MSDNGIENLFYSLASESRLDILHALCVDSLRMNEIARKINITPTEASRQIQRLKDELIIQKHPDGRYSFTNYGSLVMHFFPLFEFIFEYKQYFMVHDVFRLPNQFITRLGELSKGKLCTEIAETVNGIEHIMQSSEDYVFVITDQVMGVHDKVMEEKLSKGIKFRALIHERLVDPSHVDAVGADVERRVLSSIPGLFTLSEKEAFFAFLSMDGRVDGTGFFGSDPLFLKWAKDFFLYYWEQTNRR